MKSWIAFFCCVLPAIAQQPGAAVRVDGRDLWTVRSARAGVGPAQRAKDIRESIIQVAENEARYIGDVREADLDSESIFLINRTYMFSVTDEDAQLENRPRKELFDERKRIVLDSIKRYRESRRFTIRLRSIVLALGAMVLTIALLILLHWVYKKIQRRVSIVVAVRTRRGELASWYRVFQQQLLLLARVLIGISYGLLAVVICAASGGFVLGLFPVTAGVSDVVRAEAWAVITRIATGITDYIPNLVFLIAIGVFTYGLIWILKTVATAVETETIHIRGLHQDWAKPTYTLLKVLLILFALVIAFPYLPGGESPALKGASIFIGVLVSLGSGSAMGNVIAGLILTYMRPFRIGDRVQIADSTGDVVEKSLLVTRIRTIKNVEVILPNSAVLGAHILNYSAKAVEQGLILHTTVTLGYDVPWRTVEKLMIQAALRTDGVLPEPKPFVLQTSLNDWHISYELNAYTHNAQEMARLYSDLHKHIQEEFNAAGVEIMSPTYLSLRDGNTVTIPEALRPKDYRAPAFRISTESTGGGASAAGTGQA